MIARAAAMGLIALRKSQKRAEKVKRHKSAEFITFHSVGRCKDAARHERATAQHEMQEVSMICKASSEGALTP